MFTSLRLCVLCVFALNPFTYVEAQQLAHFHHLHLNTTDPAQAIKFYTSKFDCQETKFLDEPAVRELIEVAARDSGMETGKGKLVIRSISKVQRPRRPRAVKRSQK